MECSSEAAAFFLGVLKAAASLPHSMGFAVNNGLQYIASTFAIIINQHRNPGLLFTSHAKLAQDVFHQAPTCQRRLEKIEADKRGEPKPVGIDPMSQRQAD
jgi:hypothetical protein